MKMLSLIFCSVITTTSLYGQIATKTHYDSINSILDKYYELHTIMLKAGSTVQDVDDAFSLFSKDFTYEHARFDSYYTKESLYKSAIRNLQEGNYNGRVAGYKIHNRIIGLNAATVQKTFLNRKDDAIVESDLQMTLFEFTEGKISRIVEYW